MKFDEPLTREAVEIELGDPVAFGDHDPEEVLRYAAAGAPPGSADSLDRALVDQAMQVFHEIREMRGIRKRPSTSELIDWIAVLKNAGLEAVKLEKELPFLGALLKKEQDLAAYADQLSGGRRFRS